jgi:LPS-assembly protein
MRYLRWVLPRSNQVRKPDPRPRNNRPPQRRPSFRLKFPTIPIRKSCPSPSPNRCPRPELPSTGRRCIRPASATNGSWTGEVVLYYKNYVIHADKVVYHQSTSTVEAEGHLQLRGGPNDADVTASHGEMHLEDHTGRFYDVIGSFGVRRLGKTLIYSTPDPFLFTGRVLIQTGEGSYRIVDGSMTSCRLPRPDWRIVSAPSR